MPEKEKGAYVCPCGRQMVYDHTDDDGSVVMLCPRFSRAWRNLWLGGWMHEGVDVPAHPDDRFALGLVWR